jgi:hypothetical protein
VLARRAEKARRIVEKYLFVIIDELVLTRSILLQPCEEYRGADLFERVVGRCSRHRPRCGGATRRRWCAACSRRFGPEGVR